MSDEPGPLNSVRIIVIPASNQVTPQRKAFLVFLLERLLHPEDFFFLPCIFRLTCSTTLIQTMYARGAKIAAQISSEELLNSSTHPHHIPPMSQRKIDILQLEPQQILEIRKSTEQEIQHFTQSLQALQTAQSKLQDCVNTIDNMEASEGGDLLVPMTALLYLPGKVAQKDRFMVDIGTGYFVEKDADSARKVYKKKLTKLGEDSKKLKEILVQKNEIMNNLTLVLRKKAMDQQQAAQS